MRKQRNIKNVSELLLMGGKRININELEKRSYESSKFSSMLGGGLSGMLFGVLVLGIIGAMIGLAVGLFAGYLINKVYLSKKSSSK